jgi:tripartite-type tricarboxylate transporter receptor subunit TctC
MLPCTSLASSGGLDHTIAASGPKGDVIRLRVRAKIQVSFLRKFPNLRAIRDRNADVGLPPHDMKVHAVEEEQMRTKMRVATAAIALCLIGAATTVVPAAAQEWPSRSLTLVVPFAAGGSSDAIARIVAEGVGNDLHQPVIVEDVTGAGGLTGTSRVAKAAPDGYQLVIGNVGTFAQSQWLYKKPPYNARTDFAPVALLTDESLVLVTRPDFPADDLRAFIAHAKANQGKLRYASSGAGGSNHLSCLLLDASIGIEASHIPYRSVVQSIQDLMAGRVDYACLSLPVALPQITAKTIKPIALLSKKRSAALPNLASAHEQGLTGFDIPSWYALFLPAGSPPAIVDRLNRATSAALDNPATRQRLERLGGEIVAPERRSPQYLARWVAAEIDKWEGPVKASGLAF